MVKKLQMLLSWSIGNRLFLIEVIEIWFYLVFLVNVSYFHRGMSIGDRDESFLFQREYLAM